MFQQRQKSRQEAQAEASADRPAARINHATISAFCQAVTREFPCNFLTVTPTAIQICRVSNFIESQSYTLNCPSFSSNNSPIKPGNEAALPHLHLPLTHHHPLTMPKSKRAKVVHLTQVEKKDKEARRALFDKVREAADEYTQVFVFGVENMRNTYLKDVRAHFADSRIFFGKTKVMAKALGQTDAEEYQPGLSKLSTYLTGNVGLLFTNREAKEVLEYFENFSELDYARAGVKANRDFVIPEGVVYTRGGEIAADDDVALPHSLEVTVRKWGMPTKLHQGKVMLDSEYAVCKEGQTLNSHQTALLKLFGVAMCEFRVQVKAYWSSASEEVTEVAAEEAMEQ